MSWRADPGSVSWLIGSLYPSISLCMNPSTGCVSGCLAPSLSINSFPTPLTLDAICKSFSGVSYLCGSSQTCPAAALPSVCQNSTYVKKELSSIQIPFPAVYLVISCNSAHATSLWCPCLCCTIFSILYICVWADLKQHTEGDVCMTLLCSRDKNLPQ